MATKPKPTRKVLCLALNNQHENQHGFARQSTLRALSKPAFFGVSARRAAIGFTAHNNRCMQSGTPRAWALRIKSSILTT